MQEEETFLTEDDLKEFLSAKTYEEQLEILLKHSQKNQTNIERRKLNKLLSNTSTPKHSQ